MTEPSERPTSPTPEGRALAAFDKCYDADPAEQPIEFYIAAEIRAAEQAAREERDREWCEAVGLDTMPPKEGAKMQPFLLEQARRAALEEAAEAMSRGNPVHYHSAIAWLLARAKEEQDGPRV